MLTPAYAHPVHIYTQTCMQKLAQDTHSVADIDIYFGPKQSSQQLLLRQPPSVCLTTFLAFWRCFTTLRDTARHSSEIYIALPSLSALLIACFITVFQYWCRSSSKSSPQPTHCQGERECKWRCKLVNTSFGGPASWYSLQGNHIPLLAGTIWLIAPQIIWIQTTALSVHCAQREVWLSRVVSTAWPTNMEGATIRA